MCYATIRIIKLRLSLQYFRHKRLIVTDTNGFIWYDRTHHIVAYLMIKSFRSTAWATQKDKVLN